MRMGFNRLAVIGLALAAASLTLAGDQGPPPKGKAGSAADTKGLIPKLPPGTLPPVVLPFDPTAATPIGLIVVKDPDKDTSIRQPATIRPAQEVHVNALVSGQVTEILVAEGDVVKAGQVLARLDRTEYELQLKRADARLERAKAGVKEVEATLGLREAEVKRAEAAVKQAEAQLVYAKRKLDRLHELLEQKAVDQCIVDEAEAQFRAAEAQVEQAAAALKVAQSAPDKGRVEAARADVAVAEVERQLARFHLDATEVRAPAAGTVLARHAEVGDGVGPTRANGRPTPLFEVADLTHLDAVANVPEKDLAALKVGQKCEVRLDAVPGVVHAGKVSRIAPVVSWQDRTAAVRVAIELPRDDRRLRPGMYGTVRILGKE